MGTGCVEAGNPVGILVPTVVLGQLPFAHACESWLESRLPYLAKKTIYEYRLNIRTLSTFFGELRLTEIDGDLVRAYQRMRQQTCGPSAINHELNLICQMRKRIGLPLADYQPLPQSRELRGRALGHEEKERLLRIASSNPNWEAAFLFAVISVNTSAGPKEVYTLRLQDVDVGRAIMRVQPGGAKNIHRIRTIPLNSQALEAVKRALERAAELGATEPDHYIFPFRVYGGQNPRFDPNRHQTTFKTSWTALRTAAQLPGFRMYDLRHHAITAMLENPDISEQTVEEIAGHINPRMKKRYSHIRLEHRRAAVDAILGIKKIPPKRVSPKKSTEGTDAAQQLITLLGKLLKTG